MILSHLTVRLEDSIIYGFSNKETLSAHVISRVKWVDAETSPRAEDERGSSFPTWTKISSCKRGKWLHGKSPKTVVSCNTLCVRGADWRWIGVTVYVWWHRVSRRRTMLFHLLCTISTVLRKSRICTLKECKVLLPMRILCPFYDISLQYEVFTASLKLLKSNIQAKTSRVVQHRYRTMYQSACFDGNSLFLLWNSQRLSWRMSFISWSV